MKRSRKKRTLSITIIIIVILIIAIARLNKLAYIISGYQSKELASWVFLAHRDKDSVLRNDLNFFPINLANATIDRNDSAVISSVYGLGKQKAIYRAGRGATLLSGANEVIVKHQAYKKPSYPNINPDTVNWPQGNKDAFLDKDTSNINYTRLERIINASFDNADTARKTNAVLVLYNGKIAIEKYANGFNKNTLHTGWSMTKSIINTLIGIAVKHNLVDIYAPNKIQEWQQDDRKNINIDQLLHMTSGLEWDEGYGSVSDVTHMLYTEPSCYAYAINKPLQNKPGSNWYYSSGTTNIISGILRSAINNDQEYLSFPREQLFNKTGMHSMVMETDASGNFIASSYAFATARDWARLGLLYLHNGIWNGEEILPKGWVEYSTKGSEVTNLEYGAQIWLNQSQKEMPNCPKSMFYFDGFHGQRVFIVPSHNAVIVRLGYSEEGLFDFNLWLKNILDCLEKKHLGAI
ncbi:MAG: serine hydrolase domain-containing protein [Bacteroidales bacterium]